MFLILLSNTQITVAISTRVNSTTTTIERFFYSIDHFNPFASFLFFMANLSRHNSEKQIFKRTKDGQGGDKIPTATGQKTDMPLKRSLFQGISFRKSEIISMLLFLQDWYQYQAEAVDGGADGSYEH